MRLIRTIATAVVLAALIASTCAWAGPADVSPAQRDELKGLASDTREKAHRVRDELVQARTELFQAYRMYDLDERRVKAAIERVGKSQLALLDLHLDNQIAIRRILNESQFNEFCRRMKRSGGHAGGLFSPHEERLIDRLPDKEMLQAIGATPDQSRRIWRDASDPERRALAERLMRNSKQMIELYSRYELDVAAARKLLDTIHQSQMDLAGLNRRNQQTLRSVLTEQQFDRLQEEISKRIKQHEHKRPTRRFGGSRDGSR